MCQEKVQGYAETHKNVSFVWGYAEMRTPVLFFRVVAPKASYLVGLSSHLRNVTGVTGVTGDPKVFYTYARYKNFWL